MHKANNASTASTDAAWLYRSEAFAEDLPEWQEPGAFAGHQAAAGALLAHQPPLPRLSAALLCALPLGAAVLGAAASAWGV